MKLKLLRIAQKLFLSIVKLLYHHNYSFGDILYSKNQILASPPLTLVENITVVCTRSCIAKVPFWENTFSQKIHLNGFSPVCVR